MPGRKQSRAPQAGGEAARPRAGAAAASRGLFGRFGRLFYWSFVLAIWGGIARRRHRRLLRRARCRAPTTWSIPDRPPNVKIVSVDGQLLANRGMTGGEAVGLHEMSPYIPQAVMAIEDRRFYSHFGVDPIGLARAMVDQPDRAAASSRAARR